MRDACRGAWRRCHHLQVVRPGACIRSRTCCIDGKGCRQERTASYCAITKGTNRALCSRRVRQAGAAKWVSTGAGPLHRGRPPGAASPGRAKSRRSSFTFIGVATTVKGPVRFCMRWGSHTVRTGDLAHDRPELLAAVQGNICWYAG